jgi:hypothetical protein
MNLLHCSLDQLTLTCGLFCYHPYGNTIVIAPCSMIVVVFVSNTESTVLTVCCLWLRVTRALANVHYAPLWLGVTR